MGQRGSTTWVTVGLIASLCGACSDEDKGWNPPGGAGGSGGYDPRFEPLVDELEREMSMLGIAGVAVAVLEGGEVTFARGFGTRHPERDEPVAPTTLFRIASTSKMLTAVGLLQQVEQGRVDLDAPITDYLPDFDFALDATWAPSILVRQLPTHTSAISDYLEVDVPASQKEDSALASFMNGPFGEVAYLMAPAGRMFNYSNPGFSLAGLITEVASGQYYREYLDEHLFTPLGMDRTFFLPAEVLADGDYAHGATIDRETLEPIVVGPDSYDNAWGRPAGYAFSSVLDQAEFMRFLRNGDDSVLSDSMRRAMQEPQVNTEFLLDMFHYSYGLFIERGLFLRNGQDYYEIDLVSHNGALDGYSADFYYVPALDFGFITLANGDGGYFDDSLAVALRTLCELPAATTPPDLTVDPASYDDFVGSYLDPYGAGRIEISRDGGALQISMPDVDAYDIQYDSELLPAGPDNFVLSLEGYPLPVTFIRDGQGQAEYFRTRTFVGARVTARHGERTATQISPDALLSQLRRQPPLMRKGWLAALRRSRDESPRLDVESDGR